MVGSATLVAVIVPRAAAEGAVNTPAVLMVPSVVAHVTLEFVVAPCTVAVNEILALGAAVATAGETMIELTAGVTAEPWPWRGSITDRCAVSVTKDTLPSTVPVLEAANLTPKLVLCPAESVVGIGKPDMLKPAPANTA